MTATIKKEFEEELTIGDELTVEKNGVSQTLTVRSLNMHPEDGKARVSFE